MSDYRNMKAGQTGKPMRSNAYDVPTPARADGVGAALRKAFRCEHDSTDQFNALLRKIDKH